MRAKQASNDTVIDFITGQRKVNTGPEANRQKMEQVLVQEKGFYRHEIEVDVPIVIELPEGEYQSAIDLAVQVKGYRYMAIKCAPGSLASREREIIAAARLLDRHQIPIAIATDGTTAHVWDTVSGKHLGEGLDAIPTRETARAAFDASALKALAADKRHRTALVFKSYDTMNVNRGPQ